MLIPRLISGILLTGAIVLVCWFDEWLATREIHGLLKSLLDSNHFPPGTALMGIILILILPANLELRTMLDRKGITIPFFITEPASLLLILTAFTAPLWNESATFMAFVLSLLGTVVLLAWMWQFGARRIEQAAVTCGASLLVVMFVAGLGSFYLLIRQDQSGWVVLALIFIVKISDIGAYVVGKLFGRHKLIPWLSPGKTWAGLFGGIAASALVAAGLAAWLQAYPSWTTKPDGGVIQFSPLYAAIGGAALAMAGVIGGMILSMFKRDAQMKDSAHFIPGMGGVLDVLDSLLLAAPVAYWLLKMAPIA